MDVTAEQANALLNALESDTPAKLSITATPETLSVATLSTEGPFTPAIAAEVGLAATADDQLIDIAWKNGRLGCLLMLLNAITGTSTSTLCLADNFVAMTSINAPLALNLYLTLKVNYLEGLL